MKIKVLTNKENWNFEKQPLRDKTHQEPRTNPKAAKFSDFSLWSVRLNLFFSLSLTKQASGVAIEIECVTDRANQHTATVHLTNTLNNNENKDK